jgi:uncharacterized protein DUF5691
VSAEHSPSLWDDLVTAAVIGTDRRPFAGTEATGQLGDALLRARGSGLLATTAVVWAYREAGREVPVTEVRRSEAAPPDDRPLLAQGAVRALTVILDDRRFRPLLDEWLALAVRAGGRLPGEASPKLLDAAHAEQRPAAAAVVGPLAVWLGARNPNWEWAQEDPVAGWRTGSGVLRDPEALQGFWGSGSDGERLAMFAELRDEAPALALELLAGSWGTEPGTTRAAFVTAMATGLSDDDEGFLEAVLDDNRKDVRAAGAALLARLPGSRRAERVRRRAVALVAITGRIRPVLNVAAPPAVDEAIIRDGIDPSRANRDGPQWQIRQLVAGTPLSAWAAALGREPSDLVRLALAAGALGLLQGWADAAEAQRDAEWARALLGAGHPPTSALLASLGPEGAEVAAVAAFRAATAGQIGAIAASIAAPWSAAVTAAGLDAMARIIETVDARPLPGLRELLAHLALVIDPAESGPIGALLSSVEKIPEKQAAFRIYWAAPLANFAAMAGFRASLHKEFQ